MNIFKYVFLGFKRKWRESESFRFDAIGLMSLVVLFPIGFWLFADGHIANTTGKPDVLNFIFSILSGLVFWFLVVIGVALLIGISGKVIEVFRNLVAEGKKEEVRVFEILKEDQNKK